MPVYTIYQQITSLLPIYLCLHCTLYFCRFHPIYQGVYACTVDAIPSTHKTPEKAWEIFKVDFADKWDSKILLKKLENCRVYLVQPCRDFCMDLRGLISVSDSSCYQGEGGWVRHVRHFVHKRKHYGDADGSNVLGNYSGLAENKKNILI